MQCTKSCALYCFFSWYDEHLKECEGGNDEELRIRIVLLTDDKDNKEKAKKEGIISFTGTANIRLIGLLTPVCNQLPTFQCHYRCELKNVLWHIQVQ